MNWTDYKFAQYRRGVPATWLERRMLEHANPVHFVLAWVAMVGLCYGLWTHDWPWIVGSLIVAAVGHVYCWLWEESDARDATRVQRNKVA